MLALAALSVLLPLLAKTAVAVSVWGQCGGIGYTGSTTCDSGTTCVYLNDWYSQCQPGTGSTTTTTNPGPTTTTTTNGHVPTGTPPSVGYNQVTNFGTNPTNVGMYSYVPSGLSSAPGLVVALHYCTGSAQGYYSGTQWKSYADQKKNFIVVYGDSPRSGKCWDVSSSQTLQHDGGSDSLAIANVVRYALNNWGVDASKVFVTGSSSGAMMANVLAGAYPDLFKVAVSVSGVPYGCFATTDGSMWNSQCSGGQRIMSGAQWGDMVRSAYPGYSGSRPNMMLIHGTADTTLAYANFAEMIKQWTNVLGISESPTSTRSNDPQSGWTHTSYGSGQVQAYSVAGGTHDVASSQIHEDIQIAYFGL